MRRLLVPLLALVLVIGAAPAPSDSDEPDGTLGQVETGQMDLPTRFPFDDPERDGWPGLARSAWLCAAAANGTIGYVFDVLPHTWGGAFVIDEVDDLTGEAIVDVYFYSEFGDCAGVAAPVSNAQYASDHPREMGTIPPRTTKAVVFTHNGIDTTFRYRGFQPPRVDLASADLDLLVLTGTQVTWRNDTGEYAVVRHTPEEGSAAFDSGTVDDDRGIPAGGTFTHTFGQAGEFPYETSTGTGTVTVVDHLDE